MTNEEQLELVREKIARVICTFSEDNTCCAECEEGQPPYTFPDCFPDIREKTSKILSIPEIKVVAPDQHMPIPYMPTIGNDDTGELGDTFDWGTMCQRDMLKDNWVKVIK